MDKRYISNKLNKVIDRDLLQLTLLQLLKEYGLDRGIDFLYQDNYSEKEKIHYESHFNTKDNIDFDLIDEIYMDEFINPIVKKFEDVIDGLIQ